MRATQAEKIKQFEAGLEAVIAREYIIEKLEGNGYRAEVIASGDWLYASVGIVVGDYLRREWGFEYSRHLNLFILRDLSRLPLVSEIEFENRLEEKRLEVEKAIAVKLERAQVIEIVKSNGGIRSYRGGFMGEEITRAVPLFLRRRAGLKPDEMSKELFNAGVLSEDTDTCMYELFEKLWGRG